MARHDLRRFLIDVALDRTHHGQALTRVGDRLQMVTQSLVMAEATFRLLKHVQHGDQANLGDAVRLWRAAGDGEP